MLHARPPLKETPSQTAGPYVHIGLVPNFAGIGGVYATDLGVGDVFGADVPGERIEIAGRITDGDGAPVIDAMIELWQADAEGNYSDPTSGSAAGWSRQAMDEKGNFSFRTIKPG